MVSYQGWDREEMRQADAAFLEPSTTQVIVLDGNECGMQC
jgi:hypothetical protein